MAKLNEAARDRIPATKYAFPKQRKEPLENASHVRNAAARFNQVKDVTEAERRAAWKRIEAAAKKYKVELKGLRLLEETLQALDPKRPYAASVIALAPVHIRASPSELRATELNQSETNSKNAHESHEII